MKQLKESKQTRGRPSAWTDEELRQFALNTKYKFHGVKLTPSLLERETEIGRNTWSRRMKDFIEELNNPILPNIKSNDKNDALLPSVNLIFKKHGVEHNDLQNELLDLEILLYDMYKELKQYKEEEENYHQALAERKSLQEEISKQKHRAQHYEELYNSIVLSSMYPHLQDAKTSPTSQFNIKEKLIDIEVDKEKNLSIEDLNSFFSDEITELGKGEESTKNSNMQKLLNEFDIK